MEYVVSLYYFWIPSAEVSKERVAMRVSRGGHNIPPDVIERRYVRSLKNLNDLYLPLFDSWIIVDNSLAELRLVAKGHGLDCIVINEEIWLWLKGYGTN